MSTGLALRLREGTWALHSTTERAGIMPALLRGQLPAAGFWRLQHNLLAIYQALEAGLQHHASHPVLAPLGLGPLARCAALQADLADLADVAALAGLAAPAAKPAGTPPGTPATTTPPLTRAAADYAAHLQALAQQQPPLLAAHAYVRYLGDLAGGQALRRVAQQAYQLQGEAGTRFFDFGTPAQVQHTSQALRQALDTLPLDDAGAQALVAEAQWAFAQHARLFEELAEALASP